MAKSNGAGRTNAELLAKMKDSLQREEVYLPESGITLTVWELTAAERSEYLASLSSSKHHIPIGRNKAKRELVIESHAERAALRLCSMALKDDNGHPRWSADELAGIPSSSIYRITLVASRLAKIRDEDDEDEGKGSGLSPVESETSTSPSLSAAPPSASSESD
jgi:hypothetical protein